MLGANGVSVDVDVTQVRDTFLRDSVFLIRSGSGSGPIVRHLNTERNLRPGTRTVNVIWDGRDDEGQSLKAGTYRLQLQTDALPAAAEHCTAPGESSYVVSQEVTSIGNLVVPADEP